MPRSSRVRAPGLDTKGTDLVVYVRDTLGGAVRGGAVSIVSSEGVRLVAMTGSEGRVVLGREELVVEGDLMVTAPSLSTGFLSLEGVVGDEVTIVLAPGGTVQGLVRYSDGVHAVPGLKVVAVRLADFYSGRQSPVDERRSLAGMYGETGANGAFVVDGLDANGSYRLDVLGGHSIVKLGDRTAQVRAGAKGVVLTLRDTYGVVLEFECSDAGYLKDHYSEPSLRTVISPVFGSRFYLGRTPGFPDRKALGLGDSGAVLPLMYTLKGASDHGQRMLVVEGVIPGFEPFESTVELAPMRESQVKRHVIELVKNATAWGTLKVELVGDSARFAANGGVAAQLSLTHATNGQVLSYLAEWKTGGTEIYVGQVPTGAYTWALSIEGGWVHLRGDEDEPVRVLEGEGGRIEVEFPADAGYLRVEAHGGEGFTTCILQLAKGRIFSQGGFAEWIRNVPCGPGPQIVGPLPSGIYDVLALFPEPLPEGVHTFEIRPGEIHTEILAFQ